MERLQPTTLTEHAFYRFIVRWAVTLELLTQEQVSDYRQAPRYDDFPALRTWLLAQLPHAVFVEDEDGNDQQIWALPPGILLVVRDRTVMTVLPSGATRTNRRPDRSGT